MILLSCLSSLLIIHLCGFSRQESREKLSHWSNGLLAIWTFGNNDVRGDENQEKGEPMESLSSSPDLSDFTQDEVGKLQKELRKLLTRKLSSKTEEPIDLQA
ncbi:hypothetical protein SAY87_002155 [Trapa incisa]|uniref:Uncharacterized protein n=1 Tax=Trapa incisa TaxID=236973 RepID=A0AAN7PUD1_9MYRT|nr:hypothetical protein SAY87_002155 [Trapa incisa]